MYIREVGRSMFQYQLEVYDTHIAVLGKWDHDISVILEAPGVNINCTHFFQLKPLASVLVAQQPLQTHRT